jgi:hypothetical protein
VSKFRHGENGHFWCYFDVSGHFRTFWFYDLFSSLSTRVEISTCRKWSILSKFTFIVDQRSSGVAKHHFTRFYEKSCFDPKTPLFCQKKHLTFGAAGHDRLTPSSNLAFRMSQGSCVPNLVTLGQRGRELSIRQTDGQTDRQTDRQTEKVLS